MCLEPVLSSKRRHCNEKPAATKTQPSLNKWIKIKNNNNKLQPSKFEDLLGFIQWCTKSGTTPSGNNRRVLSWLVHGLALWFFFLTTAPFGSDPQRCDRNVRPWRHSQLWLCSFADLWCGIHMSCMMCLLKPCGNHRPCDNHWPWLQVHNFLIHSLCFCYDGPAMRRSLPSRSAAANMHLKLLRGNSVLGHLYDNCEQDHSHCLGCTMES